MRSGGGRRWLHVFAEETSVETEDARQAVLRVGDLQLHGFLDEPVDFFWNSGVQAGILGLDAVGEVEAEVHADGFIARCTETVRIPVMRLPRWKDRIITKPE